MADSGRSREEQNRVNALDALTECRGLALCWTRNAGWLLGHQGMLIGIDLDLEPPGHRLAEPLIHVEEVAPRLSALFITHGDDDHFNTFTCRALAAKSQCRFVLPANCTVKAITDIGIPKERIHVVASRPQPAGVRRPAVPDGHFFPFEILGIHVAPQRALHGHRHSVVWALANLDDCGYLLTIGGKKLFHPGDTVLLDDHLALGRLDVLFISPTEHNMHDERAAFLIEHLKPKHVFPQHFETYRVTPENAFWTVGYPDELALALSEKMRSRYHKLDEAAVFVIE